MPPVFVTNSGAPHTEIAGLPTLPADGKGGVLLDRAAETRPELQDHDGQPLTGAALKSAAEAFADSVGVQVSSISEAKAEKLPQLAGAFSDRPTAADVAQANHEALYGPLEAEQPGTPADEHTPDTQPADEAPSEQS